MGNNQYQVRVGVASCGIAAGADKALQSLNHDLKPLGMEATMAGCLGLCYLEPLVEVVDPNGEQYLYGNVDEKGTQEIVHQHIKTGRPVQRLLVSADMTKQSRFTLKNCGQVDPEDIKSYLTVDGYSGLKKALVDMTPEMIIAELKESGLRGRGGAGFPTWLKWSLTRKSEGMPKYVVCNADEGDPGAFMDRSILESDPHSVLEGMTIAAYAIGASKGYLYVRAEYPLAIKRLRIAIQQAEEEGFLGEDILGSAFSFSLEIREGAGAFVCGEETALLMSIEGRRGMPRFRPPYPAEAGLFGQPTSINNVETLANVPKIIHHGAAAFNQYGTAESKGTKVFALAGKTKHGGLVEIPMGTTINELVYDIGGGISTGKSFKAIQTGGPSGGCIPASLGNTPVDYESLAKIGAIMGSGGLLVMDEDTCMVDLAKFFLTFAKEESCGKCSFCRIGTEQMLRILTRITDGQGQPEDLQMLKDLSHQVKAGSLCGLGQTVPNPVLTTLQYFGEEYQAHITDKTCPAKQCKALIEYHISDACRSCGLCPKACPTDAISGSKGNIYVIDPEQCIRCGLCLATCKFGAIEVISEPKPATGKGANK